MYEASVSCLPPSRDSSTNGGGKGGALLEDALTIISVYLTTASNVDALESWVANFTPCSNGI